MDRLARAAGVLLLAGPASAQVASDACANAPALTLHVPLSSGWAQGNTANGTVDGSTSCSVSTTGPDAWFSFTPTIAGNARAYVLQTGYGMLDWTLSIHTGCPGSASNEIACSVGSPFAPAGSPRVEADLSAGQTYWFRMAAAQGGSGIFTLHLEFPTETWPLHDDPSRAVAICPGVHAGDNRNADLFDPLTHPCVGLDGVWYRYVPAASGSASVDTCTLSTGPSPATDITLAVFEGATMVACAVDNCQYRSFLSFSPQAGHEYWIRVADFLGPSGTFVLRLQGPPAAENTCGSLPQLKDGLQLVSLVNGIADGASGCDPGGEPDLAYAFTAPGSGMLRVTTCGTDDGPGPDAGEDTVLSIHTGCPATAANTIACNDNATPVCAGDAGMPADAAVEVPLLAGQQVVVRVTRAGAQTSEHPILITASFVSGFAFCSGDGSAAACPCGNTGASGHGCGHSQGGSARLAASGNPVLSADTLTLSASGTLLSTIGLYIQGSLQVAAGNGLSFGDGLRCVGGSVVRLGVRASTNGASSFGHLDGTGASVSVRGLVPAGGGLRHYQLWFRDALPFCTSATFNLTNGLSITWSP